MTHLCVSKLTTIGSGNGLSPGRRQAIIWTNAGILLIGPIGTNFSEILIEIHTVSSKKIYLKISSGKWRPFCLGLNVLTLRTVPDELAHVYARTSAGVIMTKTRLCICLRRDGSIIVIHWSRTYNATHTLSLCIDSHQPSHMNMKL